MGWLWAQPGVTTDVGGYGSRIALAALARPGRRRILIRFSKQPGGYASAFPRRDGPEFLQNRSPRKRGRRECREPAAPAASRAGPLPARTSVNSGTIN